MGRLKKLLTWTLVSIFSFTILAYNIFVSFRYGKLPENREPAAVIYSDRIQKIFWETEFGGDSMRMHPMPFWKWLINFRQTFHTQGMGSPSFKAASQAGKILLYRTGYNKRTIEFQLDWLFASIWISKNWSGEEVVNTLLSEYYFGHTFYGLKAASNGYFGIEPDELTNEEMVFLSGLSRRPASENPWSRPEAARKLAAGLLRRVSKNGRVPVSKDPELCFKRLKPSPDTELGSP